MLLEIYIRKHNSFSSVVNDFPFVEEPSGSCVLTNCNRSSNVSRFIRKYFLNALSEITFDICSMRRSWNLYRHFIFSRSTVELSKPGIPLSNAGMPCSSSPMVSSIEKLKSKAMVGQNFSLRKFTDKENYVEIKELPLSSWR